jgi:hypothetical protein
MKRIITMITAAALGLMAWTSHAASAIAAYQIGNGEEDYCDTWEDVVSKVASATDSGQSITITLWGDDGVVEMENMFTLPANANVTLDLNGCSLACADTVQGPGSTVSVSGGSTLTITDSSEDWSGRIAWFSGELVRVESSSTLIIKGGTFKDNVVSIAGGNCTIYGGKFDANQYSERSIGGYLDSSVSWPASATDGYYVIGTPGTTPAATTVAKIGETPYTSLQDAVDAAVTNEDDDVTIEIVSNITLTDTLKIQAKNYSAMTLRVNNEKYTVTYKGVDASAGVMVDAVNLTIKGTGTWQRVSGSAPLFLIGSLSPNRDQEGIVAIQGGTYVNNGTNAVMYAANGAIAVVDGIFEVKGASAPCLYAEAPTENGDTYSGLLLVVAGTIKGPTDGTVALVSVEDKAKKAGGVMATGTAKLVGSATAAELTSGYLVTQGKNGLPVATSDYEFKLVEGSTDTYEIVKKAAAAVATVTIGTKVTNCATWAEIATAISTLTSGDVATITLEQPVTASSTVSIPASSAEVTFDLNGQTVSMAADTVMLEANKGSKLTVQDSDPEKKGRFAVASGVNYEATVLYVSGATLVATGGIYDGTFAEIKSAGGMVQTPSSATISGGSFIASKNSYEEDAFLYEGYLAPGGAATKKEVGGTEYWVVTSPVATVTVTPDKGTATTTSCKTWAELAAAVAGTDARYVSVKLLQPVTADYVLGSGFQRILSFTFDLNGQTVSMTAAGTSDGKTDFDAIIALNNCGTLTVTDTSTGKNGRFAVASGETYTGTIFDKDTGLAIEAGVFDASLGGSSSVKISGGKFLAEKNSDGEKFAFEAKVVTGMEAKKDGDYWVVESVPLATVTINGKETKCESWEAVNTALAGATSATIKLGQSQTSNGGAIQVNSGEVTLDLNGKTISASDTFSKFETLVDVDSSASVKIIDSSKDQTGRLVAPTGTVTSVSGTLTIEAGIFDGKVHVSESGTCSISGGKFRAAENGGTTFLRKDNVVDGKEAVLNGLYWEICTVMPFSGTATIDGVTKTYTSWSALVSDIAALTSGTAAIKIGEADTNVVLNSTLTINGADVTLDLNGQTLTLANNAEIFVNSGKLTIDDSSEEKTGCVTKDGTSTDQGIWTQPNAELVINAGTFDVIASCNSVEASERKISVKNGSFIASIYDNMEDGFKLAGDLAKGATSEKVGDYWVVTTPFATVTIDGAKVDCKSMSELISKIENLKSGSTAEVKLNEAIELGDEFKVPTGANVTLDLNGQTLTTKNTQTDGRYTLNVYGTLTITDSSEDKSGRIVPSEEGTNEGILVEDGTLIIDEGIIDVYIGTYKDYTITLNGGSYDSAIYTEEWIKRYAPAGSVVAKNEAEDHLVLTTPFATVTVNGVETPCMSIADVNTAIADKPGTTTYSTIKLGRSQTADVTLRIGSFADVTLDLNGKTLTSSSSESSLIYVMGTLTITDTSTAKTGRIVAQKIATIYDDKSLLTIEAGTFDGAISHDRGTFVIRGGSFRAAENGGTETFTHQDSIDTTAGVVVPTKTTKVDGVDYWVVAVPTVGGTVKIDGVETNITSWAELVTVVSNKTSGTVEITLTEDTTLPKTLEINGASVTLDLNGQNLTLGDKAIIDAAEGTLTINDSSDEKTGRVTFNETSTGADYEHGILADDEAKLVINAGTFDVVVYGDPAEINGGKFIAKYNTEEPGEEGEEEKYLLDDFVSSRKEATKQTIGNTDYWVVAAKDGSDDDTTGKKATIEVLPDGTVVTNFCDHILHETVTEAFEGARSEMYRGYLYSLSNIVAGTVQVRTTKARTNRKTGLTTTKVTATISLVGEKKVTVRGTMDADEGVFKATAKDGRELELAIDADGIKGTFDCYVIDVMRNLLKSKDKAEKAEAKAVVADMKGCYAIAWGDEENGWSTLSVTVATGGRTRVRGTLADGTRVSVSAQMVVGEEWCCVPVIVNKKSAKLSFGLWFSIDGTRLDIEGLPNAIVDEVSGLKDSAEFQIDVEALCELLGDDTYADYLPDGLSVEQSGNKWVVAGGAKAGRVVIDKKTGAVNEAKAGVNPSALKLTFRSKYGTFYGSFKAYYADAKGKLKSQTVSIRGIVVDGVGYGSAKVGKLGSVAVLVGASLGD